MRLPVGIIGLGNVMKSALAVLRLVQGMLGLSVCKYPIALCIRGEARCLCVRIYN